MALIYRHTQASMPMVGRYFVRDHTTVLHSLRKVHATTKLVERAPAPAATVEPPVAQPEVLTLTPLQAAVKQAYENDLDDEAVAERYGCSKASVKVIASNLGIKRSEYRGKVAGL